MSSDPQRYSDDPQAVHTPGLGDRGRTIERSISVAVAAARQEGSAVSPTTAVAVLVATLVHPRTEAAAKLLGLSVGHTRRAKALLRHAGVIA